MATNITTLNVEVKSSGIKETSSALGGLSVSAGNAEKRVTALTEAMARIDKVNMSATAALGSYLVKVQEQSAALAKTSAASQAAMSDTSALTAAIRALTVNMEKLPVAVNSSTASQRMNNEAMRDAHALARGLSGSLGALWVTYGNMVGMGVGLALGASLKGIVTVGKDVENTLEGIRVKGGETYENVDKVRESIMSIGKGIYAPQEVAKAFETMIMAGKSAKEALMGVNDALALATVGGTSIEKSAYAIVQVGTAMGYQATSYGRVADVIAKTAAVSMSSVESLSEAFKSGSAVGKLYGVTLADMGTSLAALSNLGIQGSSAGTSLKNFYKELASSASKVTDTMKSMKLTPESFKDDMGNFKGIAEVMATLDKGFSNLTEAERKKAVATLSNERGMKTIIELYDLYKQKVDLSTDSGKAFTTMLEKNRKEIDESYGFAALGMIQMSMTVDAQFKSVANTLQTVFLGAFQKTSPALTSMANELKALINSKEFSDAIVLMATNVAQFVLTVVEALPVIANLVEAFLAFRAVTVIYGIITAATTAIAGFAVAGGIAAAAMLPLAVAIGAVTAAYLYLTRAKRESDGEKEYKAAILNSNNYADALEKEAERTRAIVVEINKGKEAREAEAAATRSQTLAMIDNQRIATLDATEKKRKAEPVFDAELVAQSEKQKKLRGFGILAIEDSKKRMEQYAREDAITESIAAKNISRVKEIAENNRIIEVKRVADAEAANKKIKDAQGTGVLGANDIDKSAARDLFQAELNTIQGRIDSLKRTEKTAEADLQSQYRRGMIGDIALIEQTAALQSNLHTQTMKELREKMVAAKGVENKKSVEALIGNAQKAQEDATYASAQAMKNKMEELELNADNRILMNRAKIARESGNIAEAYNLEYQAKNAVMQAKLQSDIDTTTNLDLKAKLLKLQALDEEARKAGEVSELNKEHMKQFATEAQKVTNFLTGVQTASEGQGLAAMFNAATEASARLTAEMPTLIAARNALTDTKDIETANANLNKIGEEQRKMWKGVGESIATSLGSAFGEAGKAAGSLAMITMKAITDEDRARQQQADAIQSAGNNKQKIEEANISYANKSRDISLKSYADMAGAAKGFFNQNSTAYKTLHALEQAYQLFQMANLAQKLVTSLFVTTTTTTAKVAGEGVASAATIAAEMATWPAKIAGAMLSFASMGGGFVGLAMGAAAIASIVGNAGGSSGGSFTGAQQDAQKQTIATQGTGSVLGNEDEKSNSILNSLANLEKYSQNGLSMTSKMVDSLSTIASSMSNVTNSVLAAQGLRSGSAFGTADFKTANTGANIPVLGKLLGSIFGGGTSQTVTGSGINLKGAVGDIASGKGSATQYENVAFHEEGGWFSSSKDWVTKNVKDLGDDTKSALATTFAALRTGLVSAGEMIGMDGKKLSEDINKTVVDMSVELRGLKGKELEDAMNGVLSQTLDNITRQALSIVIPFQKNGEGLAETAFRVATNITVLNETFRLFGESVLPLNASGLKTSETLLAMFGGLEKFKTVADAYYESFYTEAEKLSGGTRMMKEAFAGLGKEMPASRESFRAMVDAAQKAGDTSLYASLLKLSSAFAELVPETLSAKITSVSDLRKMEIQIMELQGKSAEATAAKRFDEMAGMDTAGKSMLMRIYALQDEKVALDAATAATKALDAVNKGVQTQIDKIVESTMTTNELREKEVKGQDASTIALYKKLYALQDEKKANDEATTAAKTLADQVSNAAKALADVNKGVQSQIDSMVNATLSQEQLRANEIKGLDSSTIALYTKLYAMQDEKKANDDAALATKVLAENAATAAKALADVNKGVQSQIDSLVNSTLTTEQLRANELKGLDASTVALYKKLYALQDEQKAQQAAQQAAEKAQQAAQQAAEKAQQAAESLRKAWEDTANSLMQEVFRIRGQMSGNGANALAQAQSKFAITTAQARAGDMDAAKLLPSLSQALLTIAESNASSAIELARIRGLTAASLEGTAQGIAQKNGIVLPSFDVGTDFVPHDMVAKIHKGEKITPAAYNNDTSSAELIATVKGLREDNKQMANDIRKLKDIIVNVNEGSDYLKTKAV